MDTLVTIFGFAVGWFLISYKQTHKRRDMMIAFSCLILAIVFGSLYVLGGS